MLFIIVPYINCHLTIGVGILVSPGFTAYTLGFFPVDQEIISLNLQVGKRAMIVICARMMNEKPLSTCRSPLDGKLDQVAREDTGKIRRTQT